MLFVIITTHKLWGQSALGDFHEMEKLPNGDTLVLNRTYGDFWYGGFAGFSMSYYHGDLNQYQNPAIPPSSANPIVSFDPVVGIGPLAGLFFEYQKPNDYWGYFLKLNILDLSHFVAKTPIQDIYYKTRYDLDANNYNITISPSVRYNLLEFFYAFSGLDVGINAGFDAKQKKVFTNTGSIDQVSKSSLNSSNTKVGLHFGLGFEFLLADINSRARAKFNPTVSLHYGSNMISEMKSSWRSFDLRFGITLKFAPDNIDYDTLFFNPYWEEPPVYIVTIKDERGVEFAGFKPLNPEILDVELRERPSEIAQNISAVEDTARIEEVVATTQEPVKEPIKSKQKIKQNTQKTYTFSTSNSTAINKDLSEYLDAVADFLLANKNSEVRVNAHSDNFGTPEENLLKSKQRAEAVQKYLIRKGVPWNRVLITWQGSLKPVKPNDTPANRRANRRVEIVVVPK